MSELAAGLAASANEPVAESPTIDATLDAAFEPSPEPAASSEPASPPESTPAPVAATAPPQTTEAPATGEPPKERWNDILTNARTKAREEALAEHRDALEIVNRLRSDFTGTLAQLIEEGAADPRFSEALTTKAAAILSARGKQTKAEAEPEPDLQTADGALVYSAPQIRKWQEWNARQMERKLGEQFKPLVDLKSQLEQTQQRIADEQRAMSIAQQRGEKWQKAPLFAEHKDAILKRQAELYEQMETAGKNGDRSFDPVNAPWEAMQQAYFDIVGSQALPKLQAQQTQQMVDSAARKRAGSASDPAAAAPAQPRKARTVDEALDQGFAGVA